MKRILITGGTSGIGLETVRLLSSMDYELVLLGRNPEKLEQVKNAYPACTRTYTLDIARLEEIGPVFSDMENSGLTLDGLVHCAGVEGELTPVRKYDYHKLEDVMRIHFLAFVEMGKWFYRRRLSNEGASIVGMSSLAAVKCQRNVLDYASSKEALNVAAKVMAKEFLKRNIRVNTIMPAYVDTRMSAGAEGILDVEAVQPMGLIPPEQIAHLIAFLLSDRAAYITGAAIPVSAGMEY